MKTILQFLIDIFALSHSFLIKVSNQLGFNFTDKHLHFLIIGFLFLVLYVLTDVLFRALSKVSISILTFIFTFTLSIVVSFAIEIGQYQSGNGIMDIADVAWGVYGFITFILVFEVVKRLIKYIRDSIETSNRTSK